MKLLLGSLLAGAALLVCPAARAQNVAAAYAPSSNSKAGETTPPARSTETVVVRGIVKCPEGALPGAVVHVNNTKIYAVTDAKGAFELTVPAAASTVEVTCSFAGFADIVQRLKIKADSTTILLNQATKLPPPDRSAETSWW